MRLDEYLEIVSEQIRYTKIRSTVTEELRNHILDQAEAYEACGAFPEEAMLLYIPLFGAALYSFRGDDYKVLLKIAPLVLIPCELLWITPSIITAGILFLSLVCLFLFAVWKDWYQISKKLIFGISISGLLLMPFIFLGYIYLFGEDYQVARLQAFFSPTGLHDYIVNIAENMRIGSSLIGSSENSVYYLANGPTTYFLTDYILVSMCSIYGIFLTIAIVTGLVLIV